MYTERYWHDREFATVAALRSLVEAAGLPLVTTSIAWVLANPVITSALIGASHPDQLDASLAAADFVLTPELKTQLDNATVEYRGGDMAR
jgi:aryl-alcohol dehydrogenase-like predicted oxidoreductase